MSDLTQLSAILGLGLLFGFIARLALDNMFKHIERIKKIMKDNAEYRALEAKVALMKAKGDMHEWQTFNDGAGGTIMVCVKTGWAPKLQGFIPMEKINATLEALKQAEEYKMFRDARVQLLAHENNMTVGQMERVVESVFDIKKQFHIQRLTKLSEEMKKKAADVNKGNQI